MNTERQTDAYGLPPGTGVSFHAQHPIEGAHTARVNSGENVMTPEQYKEVLGRVGNPPQPKVPKEKKETLINRRAVKSYALGVAKTKRAGKFTRVGETFLIAVEAELDAKIRQLVIQTEEPPTHEGIKFTTTLARNKIQLRLEKLAARIIYGKVLRHPSVGQTLRD